MIWLWLAVAIVAVAALLLIWILAEAVGIRRQAERALAAGRRVDERTRVLWAIPDVNSRLRDSLGVVRAIGEKSGELAAALGHGEKGESE